MVTSLSLTDVRGQLQPGDQPAFRIWSQLSNEPMSDREVLAAIGRIVGLAHDRDGHLCDLAAAHGLREQLVGGGELVVARDAQGATTYKRAAEFHPSGAIGSTEYNRQQQQRNDAIEANRLRMIDEAAQSAYDASPLAHQKREDHAFILQTLREDGAAVLREAFREEIRAAVLELLSDLDQPTAARLRAQLEVRESNRSAAA